MSSAGPGALRLLSRAVIIQDRKDTQLIMPGRLFSLLDHERERKKETRIASEFAVSALDVKKAKRTAEALDTWI